MSAMTVSSARSAPSLRPLWDCVSPRQGPRQWAVQLLCDMAATLTAVMFAVPRSELMSQRRSRNAAFARQAAMYMAHVAFGLSYAEIGRAFGRDRTTVAYACRSIEDRRDDPSIDVVLNSLEKACGELRDEITASICK